MLLNEEIRSMREKSGSGRIRDETVPETQCEAIWQPARYSSRDCNCISHFYALLRGVCKGKQVEVRSYPILIIICVHPITGCSLVRPHNSVNILSIEEWNEQAKIRRRSGSKREHAFLELIRSCG